MADTSYLLCNLALGGFGLLLHVMTRQLNYIFRFFVLATLQVMKLRRRYDDLASEVSNLVQQRELLLTQMSEEKAEWEKLQRVRAVRSLL